MSADGPDRHRIAGARIAAEVLAFGAELCSLRDAAGRELLWQAGPAWPRHAPVLFPIVGRLNGDRLLQDGVAHRLTQHGFARDRRFAWAGRDGNSCRLVLEDDDATRAIYPFAFRFEIGFACDDDRLTVTYAVTNPGDAPLPVSAGAHPAFRWPLADGIPRDAHRITFAEPEPAPIRRLQGGLLRPQPEPSPVQGRVLALSDALFADDAVILDRPTSRALRYTADEAFPGAPTIDLAWDGFAELGVWSRAGGDFVCLEPWRGLADPAGFEGEFASKPGLMHVPPGGTETLQFRITVG